MNYKYLFILLILLILSVGTVNAEKDNSRDIITKKDNNLLTCSEFGVDDSCYDAYSGNTDEIFENSDSSRENELMTENDSNKIFHFDSDGEYSVNASDTSSFVQFHYPEGESIICNYIPHFEDNPIIRYNAFLSAESISLYYGNGTVFTVGLHTGDGNPILNETLFFEIRPLHLSINTDENTVRFNRTTDENGSVSMAVDLNEGCYAMKVTFVPGEFYDNISNTYGIDVLPTIEANNLIKKQFNDTPYYAVFLDGQGNPLADGTEVTFNINGVTYTRRINGSEGQAKLNINLNQGRYVITTINPVTNETHSDIIWVIALVIGNMDMVKYFKNATQFAVHITDLANLGVGAGENVTFDINGVSYTRQTNASGGVKLNINLQPGNYTITTTYNGSAVSNKIKVLSVLSAENLVKKQGNSNQFKVLLYDGQGNPSANRKVRFNINGVFYTKTTDNEGYARLNINLRAAANPYIITSYFNGNSILNKITVIKSALYP